LNPIGRLHPPTPGYRWGVRFRTVKALAVTSTLAIVGVATLVLANQRPQPLGAMLLSGAVGLGVGYGIVIASQRARRRAYELALRANDPVRLREAFDRHAEIYEGERRPLVLTQIAMHEATVLTHEQRWRDAAACLDRVDMSHFAAHENRAWAVMRAFVIAHLGEAAAALELLDEVDANATEEERRRFLATRGVVLQRLGRNEEAYDALSTASDEAPSALRLFYLGEAQRALGRTEDAIASYEKALALPGESGWHRSAREALSTLTRPSAFR